MKLVEVANNPKFRKMKPIHNNKEYSFFAASVANNPKFRKMKPIHNIAGMPCDTLRLRTILNLEK